MRRILGVLVGAIKRVETVVLVAMTAAMVGIIAVQVFLRFLFNSPFPWAEEAATLLLIYISFFAADVVYKEKGHLSVNYFVGLLPIVVRRIIAVLAYLLIAAFLAVFLPVSVELVRMQAGHISSAGLVIAKSWWTLPVPIAFASMLLSSLHFILEEVEPKARLGAEEPGNRVTGA